MFLIMMFSLSKLPCQNRGHYADSYYALKSVLSVTTVGRYLQEESTTAYLINVLNQHLSFVSNVLSQEIDGSLHRPIRNFNGGAVLRGGRQSVLQI